MTSVYFNEPMVYAYLLKFGEVYTVRHYPGDTLTHPVKVKSKFTGVTVRLATVGLFNSDMVAWYVDKSGFKRCQDWIDAILRQHTNYDTLWLLRAVVVMYEQ